MIRQEFWILNTIKEWSDEEWEALCDGCGKCCLIRLEDEDTGDIYNTNVHCKLYDGECGGCKDYANRKNYVPDCVKLDRENIFTLSWLPKTCAYRLIAENKPLFDWHYLISGSKLSVFDAGFSIIGRTTCETRVKTRNLPKRITQWKGE